MRYFYRNKDLPFAHPSVPPSNAHRIHAVRFPLFLRLIPSHMSQGRIDRTAKASLILSDTIAQHNLPERIRFLLRVHLGRPVFKASAQPQKPTRYQAQRIAEPFTSTAVASRARRLPVRCPRAGRLKASVAGRTAVLDPAVGLHVSDQVLFV